MSASAVAAPPAVAAALRKSILTGFLQLQHIVGQDLRRFLLLEVQRAADCHDTALMDCVQTTLVHIRKHDNLRQTEQILQIEESHHLIILGDQGFFPGDHTAHNAAHAVMQFVALVTREAALQCARRLIAALLQSGFPGSQMRDIVRSQRTDLFHFFLIIVERVIGQIHAQHFLFHFQLDVLVKRRDIRQPAAGHLRLHAFSCQIEERHLPLDIFFGCILCRLDEAFMHRQHGRAVI